MKFSAWYRASEMDRVPTGPGVFQVRTEDLTTYPSGRSAMLHYGWSTTLAGSMLAWARAHDPQGRLYFRHAPCPGESEARAACERLIDQFRRRFGRAPEVAASNARD